jgi:type 1 fimbriae regulatory protein FimB
MGIDGSATSEPFTAAAGQGRVGAALLILPQQTPLRKSVRVAGRAEKQRGMAQGQPGDEEAIKYLTRGEVERFFRSIPEGRTRDLLLFDLIYRHGLRRSEAGLLKLEHVQDGKIWIARRKNGFSGAYPLHPRSKELLARYLGERPEGSTYLLRSRRHGDGPLSGGEVNRLFHGYATAADLPADRRHVHVLRHSIGVHLANANWDIADVQDWLGHRHISSTLIYFRITNKRREAKYRSALRSPEIARTEGG